VKYARSAVAVYGLVVTAVALSALPSSRYLPVEVVRPIRAVAVALPQGWAFFTKDPTEAADHAYVRRDATWVPVVAAVPPTDAIGLSRHARAVDAEVAALVAAADGHFTACAAGADLQRCATNAPRVRREFERVEPPLCEPVLIRRAEPIPFAYGTRVSSMPSKVVIVHAACPS
jgi:hypothetical protein